MDAGNQSAPPAPYKGFPRYQHPGNGNNQSPPSLHSSSPKSPHGYSLLKREHGYKILPIVPGVLHSEPKESSRRIPPEVLPPRRLLLLKLA